MEVVPYLPALMQLENIKEVLKSFFGKELLLVLISELPVGALGWCTCLSGAPGICERAGFVSACARWPLLLAPSSKEMDLGMICHLKAQAALLWAGTPLESSCGSPSCCSAEWVLVWVDAVNSKYCMGGCLTVGR